MSKKSQKDQEAQEMAWLEVKNQLDESLFVDEQEHLVVQALVKLADDVQTEICNKADKWKINLFESITLSFPSLKVGKAAYFDLVHMSRMKRHNELSLRYVTKLKQVLNKSAYFVKLKSSKLSSLTTDVIGDAVKLPVLDENASISILGFDDVAQDKEFLDIINEAADISHEISTVLYPKLHQIYQAFCYYTKDGTVNDIKHLVDIVHYRYGGFPSESSPPRHWSTFKKFRYLNLLCERYDYDFAKTWNHRFGLNVTIDAHKNHAWKQFSELADKWQNLKMFKIPEDKLDAVKDIFNEQAIDLSSINETVQIIEHVLANGLTIYIVIDNYQIVRCMYSEEKLFKDDVITTELGKDFVYSPVVSYSTDFSNDTITANIVQELFSGVGIIVN